MTSVVLVRHAFADHADPSRWPDDSLRPLTPDGATRFRRVARGLRRVDLRVDTVLSSGWARAWETAEILHEEAGWPAPRRFEPFEPGPSTLEEVVGGLAQLHGAIALVGHEPPLSRLTSLLCTGDGDALQLEFKKGGVVLVEFDGRVEAGRGTLR